MIDMSAIIILSYLIIWIGFCIYMLRRNDKIRDIRMAVLKELCADIRKKRKENPDKHQILNRYEGINKYTYHQMLWSIFKSDEYITNKLRKAVGLKIKNKPKTN